MPASRSSLRDHLSPRRKDWHQLHNDRDSSSRERLQDRERDRDTNRDPPRDRNHDRDRERDFEREASRDQLNDLRPPLRPSMNPTPAPSRPHSQFGDDLYPRPNSRRPPKPRRRKQHPPQKGIDEFWARFNSRTPGKVYTILPDNQYAHRAAARAPVGIAPGRSAQASYEAAVKACETKVNKIVRECRRLNVKYRDPHFDLEADFARTHDGRNPSDCLSSLLERNSNLRPQSVKRVADIFLQPAFFIDGATANDVRQGKDGDCWFMSALSTLSNKMGLIQRVCVARDEKVGVYGFVFYRGMV